MVYLINFVHKINWKPKIWNLPWRSIQRNVFEFCFSFFALFVDHFYWVQRVDKCLCNKPILFTEDTQIIYLWRVKERCRKMFDELNWNKKWKHMFFVSSTMQQIIQEHFKNAWLLKKPCLWQKIWKILAHFGVFRPEFSVGFITTVHQPFLKFV